MSEIKPDSSLPWSVYEQDVTHTDIVASDGFKVAGRYQNISQQNAKYIVHACNSLPALEARMKELEEVLEWYGEQARLCRLIHSEGDSGRHNLSNDGGKKARAGLSKEACDE